VVTHQNRTSNDPALVFVLSLEEAFERCREHQRVFVLGGAEVYRQALAIVDEVWLTQIPGQYDGDTFFPAYPLPSTWEEYERQAGQEVTFLRYRRASVQR